MFLKAGALSLALLLASRLLGLVRESAQAAAFGASGMGDVAVLMLTLPDWLSGVLASGALAFVLLPLWSHEEGARIAATQRRVGRWLVVGGLLLAVLLVLAREPVVHWLAGGLPAGLQAAAGNGLAWSAAGVPLALLAALWVTRLQHERDFTGMYAANLVVNVVLIAALLLLAITRLTPGSAVLLLGLALLAAMAARLAWLHSRQRPFHGGIAPAPVPVPLPHASVWLWAAAAAGLPLALPFAARSLASHQAPGALAPFNYAWKLVELPLVLAIQLVGTLALGPIARSLRAGVPGDSAATLRRGFALAWTLACASAAGLLVAAPAVAQLLFGWGQMQPQALAELAQWARLGAWSLLPQALIAIALAALAAQEKLRVGAWAHGAALLVLVIAAPRQGGSLMVWLDLLWAAIALVVLRALRPAAQGWLPWRALGASGGMLLVVQAVLLVAGSPVAAATQWAAAILAAVVVFAAAWAASSDLRSALAR
jgi:peptidoglycan biosynthesis protein MviN/MurJ (putative lipid II flippase)